MDTERNRERYFAPVLALAVLTALSGLSSGRAEAGATAATPQPAIPQAEAEGLVAPGALEALKRAHELASRPHSSAGLTEAVQAAADAFEQVDVGLESGKSKWHTYHLNAERAGFDGLRFRTPDDVPRVVVWGFVCRPDSRWRNWNIVPASGETGAPRYHSRVKYLNNVTLAGVELQQPNRMELQVGVGTFQPGREYILWFSFGNTQPEDFQIAMNVVPAEQVVGGSRASTLSGVLGLRPLTIHVASKLGVLSSVTEILDRDPDAVRARDDCLRTPLHDAVAFGNTEVARLLLDRDADIEALDVERRTPLLWAVQWGGNAGLAFLIENGADLNAVRLDRCNALQDVAKRGFVDIAAQLAAAGMALDGAGTSGRTPLSYAVEAGRTRMALFLLGQGADVNAPQQDKMSPLYRAVLRRDVDLAGLLVNAGADVKAAGPNGRTPVDLARASGSQEMLALFGNHGQ